MKLKTIKKKEKKEKKPKVKKLSQKRANKIVFTGMSLLVIASAVGVIRANVVATNFDNLTDKVDQLAKSKNEKSIQKEVFDYSALSFYATSFAEEYLNYDASENEEEKKERLDRLEKYLSVDVDAVDETSKSQKEFVRRFKSAAVVQIKEESECLLVSLNVIYETEKEEEKKMLTQEMVLPIQTKNQLFSIVGRPYFLATTLPQGKTTELKQAEASLDVPQQEKEAIEKFLTLFFEKYANGEKQELMLLMKELVQTSGVTEFISLNESEIKYFETKQKEVKGIQVSVTFADKQTGMTHTEDFSLWLTQTENSYFVRTLKHYFTEKEGN
ncbi:MAG: conjugal transfer protein [Enterococcus faecium]|uniref:conjugal transfer protein n=1 Tax=Enterococcus faecium TaxID=1352 RepID=UPI000CF064A3|nr:conjugal transfer protein [Enterococcus faecium]EGP5630262.1 conjugal transfer protein [Enterococcus faecium]MBS6010463.1 conjugal transfer protein [Enterococcus faecium]PQC82852.1 conjugal transfer protein [Enterococcus faecium]